jgi:hypothetical protein
MIKTGRPHLTDTTVFVTTIGDKANFADCLAHLKIQTVRCRIEVIDHVAPMSAAFQQMHVRCRTPFYIQVDEDMILFPKAVQTLQRLIRRSPPNVAMICAPLWDCDIRAAIQGIKIYRHAIVKDYPYENTLSCEIRQLDQIVSAGFTTISLPLRNRSTCFGEHGKHYTPETIFSRWQRTFQKHNRLGHIKWIEPWAEWLLQRYLKSRDTLHLYAFLGAVAGISGVAPTDGEKDWREPNDVLQRIKRYFPATPASSKRTRRR